MTKNDPRLRITLYIIVSAAGVALVAWGIVTQDFIDGILPVVGGLLGVVGGGVAAKNVPTTRETPPDVLEWMHMAREALPAILNEVARLRAEVTTRANPNPTEAALRDYGTALERKVLEYVPDRAPWLPHTDEYVGEHRLREG